MEKPNYYAQGCRRSIWQAKLVITGLPTGQWRRAEVVGEGRLPEFRNGQVELVRTGLPTELRHQVKTVGDGPPTELRYGRVELGGTGLPTRLKEGVPLQRTRVEWWDKGNREEAEG